MIKMHTIVLMNRADYRKNVQKLVSELAGKYDKACYISFTNPYEIIVELLQSADVEDGKFIVIESNDGIEESQTVSSTAYLVPIRDLFEVYLLVRNLIKNDGVKHILIDSLSALISEYKGLPVKENITNLLLEVGTFRCNSSLIVFNEHQEHEVVQHLRPLIGENVRL